MPETPSVDELWLVAGDAMVKKMAAQAEVVRQNKRMVNAWRWLYHFHRVSAKRIAAGMLEEAQVADVDPSQAGIGFETIRKAVGSRRA